MAEQKHSGCMRTHDPHTQYMHARSMESKGRTLTSVTRTVPFALMRT